MIKQTLPIPQNANKTGVGVEAEITAKTKYSMPFTVLLPETLSKSEKRNITMEFKARYSKLVRKHLGHHKSLRVSFNVKGVIIKVELLKNRQWVLSENLTKEFSIFSINSLKLNQEISLILEK